jgi:hypothetical protein
LPRALPGKYTGATYLGEGGFARVSAATRADGARVEANVLKEVDEAAGKLLIHEAANWSTLKHDYIVRLDDFKICPVPYLDAELRDGRLTGRASTCLKRCRPCLTSRCTFAICLRAEDIHGLKAVEHPLKDGKVKLDWS